MVPTSSRNELVTPLYSDSALLPDALVGEASRDCTDLRIG